MNKVRFAWVVLFCLIGTSGFAQNYDPPPGSSVLADLYSPMFLAWGAGVTGEVSPASDILNPAASGAKQRLTFDLSGLTLFGTTSADQGLGMVINAGVTWPTKAGVLSGSLHLISADFSEVRLGTIYDLHLSFAKDLYPTLLVGLSLNAQVGRGDQLDWGLGADLGFVHLPGNLGFLKDFRWGIALRNLGKGYEPFSKYSAIPEPFTPALGVGFDLVQTPKLAWSLHSDLSFPSFTTLRMAIGTELGIMDRVFLDLGTGFDLHELKNGKGRDVPVSLGLSVKFGTSVRKDKSELTTTVAAAPLQNGIWTAGFGANLPIGMRDRNPPSIQLDTSPQYISPNLDGIQDDLERSLSITDERYVKGYRFLVFDAAGSQVREIVNKDERPENVSVKNILARLAYVKKGISIPPQVRWDGRTDQGAPAPDGSYTYYVEAWDDNGNTGKSAVGTVTVDNTPPSAHVQAPYLIFSPNGDGNKDTLPVEQSGSEEALWTGSIADAAAKETLHLQWEASAPPSFEWDGKNSSGVLSPDGVYSYKLSATDKAGNAFSTQVDNILINTQATPINITISDSYFSPNGDGTKDAVLFELGVPVTTGIERWTLSVIDEKGAARRSFTGASSLPATQVFDGMDDSGKVVPEGAYKAKLAVIYINGNNPNAESPPFTVDLTPPSASASADLSIFSPDGDGNKDVITIYQETSSEALWQGTIENLEGQAVRTYGWRGVADAKFQWDGRADSGQPAPDGFYLYTLKSVDRAGNSGESKRIRFELNTQATEVFLSTGGDIFSPNADGVKDTLAIRPRLKVIEGVASYTLRILNASGQTVRSIQAQNRAPQDFAWDGLDNQGRRVADGQYVAELVLDYLKGDHHQVKTSPFAVDTHLPSIEVTADYALFSPDGDGSRDDLPIKQVSSAEDFWEGAILNAKGETVRSYYWKAQAASLRWDGKDENGNRLPDGKYSYRVRGSSRAGTSIGKELKGLEIDTRPASAFLTVSSDGFSPNGDGVLDKVELKPVITLEQGIQSWTLQMVHEQAGVQKTFSGAGKVPAVLVWDGKTDKGEPAAEGVYAGLLRVEYLKGNRPQAQSTPFKLNTSGPQIELSLSPQPFSPDNDGVEDELAIALKVKDISPVSEWTLSIEDPEGHPFVSFSGKGVPAERIIWNGLSDSGELVQAASDYSLRVTIQDRLGNTRAEEKLIAVDVLVIREGDKLKIRIPSITFPPNSADLAKVEDLEKAAKNDWVLGRLAQILSKYNTYDFRIEGHANLVYWNDSARAEREEKEELAPLSLARAEAVKNALVALGLKAERISVAGLGGTNPIVPFGDEENRWKNRRVEFILLKK
jgi:flagellar hook assembly protein FlgD/outer membrane protein OmpA-like peptidoglycan-associated protein